MSRANAEEQLLLDAVLKDGHYDPSDKEMSENLLRTFNVQITEETEGLLTGWSVLWKHGGGLACPPMPEDQARMLIALSCYLDLVGVDVSLTDTLAYWYVRGPKLVLPRVDRSSKQGEVS